MTEYAVVIEQGETSFGVWVPDLPGCVSAAPTAEEAMDLIREAIQLHIQALREEGLAIPLPRSTTATAAVSA